MILLPPETRNPGSRMPPPDPHDSFVYIYWNGPEGISEENRTQLYADGVNSMAVADFNGDGMLDLFVGSYHKGEERDIDSFIYWNRPGRGFSESDCTRLRTHSVSGSIAADFNGDGRIDLAVANHKIYGDHTGYSTVWWNCGGDFHPDHVTDLPTEGPHGMASVEPGNQLTRGPEEYYTSTSYRVGADARSVRFEWEAEIPPGTSVRGRLKIGEGEWTRWLEAGERAAIAVPAGAEAVYQLEISAERSLRTPRITEVKVIFED